MQAQRASERGAQQDVIAAAEQLQAAAQELQAAQAEQQKWSEAVDEVGCLLFVVKPLVPGSIASCVWNLAFFR